MILGSKENDLTFAVKLYYYTYFSRFVNGLLRSGVKKVPGRRAGDLMRWVGANYFAPAS